MSLIKKTISIDKHLVQEANLISYNFSSVVEAALKDYIQQHRAQEAIASFGKWTERDKDSAEIVRDLRQEDDRNYVKRHDLDDKK
jgi:post-segregation antitoxin (ccd killing protein)